MRRLLLATTNPDKLREIQQILAGVDFETLTLAAWRVDSPLPVPDETGATFAENARSKALYYADRTGELTVAEDSGLEIDALGGAPGVESSRFAGLDTPYSEKFARISEALRAAGAPASSARFVCAVALARPGVRAPDGAPPTVTFETVGTIEGRIAPEPRGTGGFGYDPIFFYPPFDCTLAEAADRKSAVSHRGQAFRALRSFLAGMR